MYGSVHPGQVKFLASNRYTYGKVSGTSVVTTASFVRVATELGASMKSRKINRLADRHGLYVGGQKRNPAPKTRCGAQEVIWIRRLGFQKTPAPNGSHSEKSCAKHGERSGLRSRNRVATIPSGVVVLLAAFAAVLVALFPAFIILVKIQQVKQVFISAIHVV